MKDTAIYQLFENQVEKNPEAIALIEEDLKKSTYNELNRMANKIAHYLHNNNIGKNDIVAIISKRNSIFIAGVLGILKTGAAYLPIPPNYPAERIEFILKDAKVKMSLCESINKLSYSDSIDINSILSDDSLEDTNLNLRHDINSYFYVIYTSGSTGMPKGTKIYQNAFINLLDWYITEFRITSQDTVLLFTQIGFDLTQKNIFCTLAIGGRICLYSSEQYNYYQLSELIQENAVTMINCTPSAFMPLIELNQKNNYYKLKSLRCTVLGGEPIKISTLQKWVNSGECSSIFANTYGPTECADIAAYYIIKENDLDNLTQIPIGKPIPNVKLLVVNEQGCEDVCGELYIGGIGVGDGYIGLPELNMKSFIQISDTRYYKTGDQVSISPEGNLLFLGRQDNQTKYHGNRIELEEIEYQILKNPHIKDAAVVIHNDSDLLTAFIVATEDFDQEQLKNNLSEYLPGYMIPTQYITLTRLPLSLNGKIERLTLSNYELPKLNPQISDAAANTTQDRLISILEKYNISIDNGSLNINEQLDSFTFINLIIDIEIEFELEINDDFLVYEVFIELTLDDLIDYINEKRNI